MNTDLSAFRAVASKALLAMLWVHPPLVLIVGLMLGGGWLLPVVLMTALAVAATLSWKAAGESLQTRLVIAVSLVGAASILTYQLSGHPWQLDMHMYFFAVLACLVAFCDERVILAAAGAIALHHLTLNFLLPAAIYPGGSQFGRVVLHAVVVVLEAGVLAWVCRTLVRLFQTTADRIAEAEVARAARDKAEAERTEAERQARIANDLLMRQLADKFEDRIGHIVQTVSVAAGDLEGTSTSMSRTAEDASRQAAAVAAASTEASSNVATVATATEELSASIAEISQQVDRSARVANKAAAEAQKTDEVVAGLAADARKIGEVVTLIQAIASQTNLLALNATIEAARAGEHGKGFAVVASEVKILANQTAKATEEIAAQVEHIQSATGGVVQAMKLIGKTIDEINEISGAIAAAIQEQGAATREIAGSVSHAARGTSEVNETIGGVQEASESVGAAATHVLRAASDLSSQSEHLRDEVGQFLGSIRRAA